MSTHRGFFPTIGQAESAAAAALAREEARLKAAAKEAGQQPETATPTTRTTVLSVAPLAAGASKGALSLVTWRIVSADGHSEIVRSVMPTAQVPITVLANGTVRLVAILFPVVHFKASLPRFVTTTTTNPIVAGIAAGFLTASDVVTGKRFTNKLVPPLLVAGPVRIEVEEVSTSEAGELTYGSVLDWVITFPGFAPQARVDQMEDVAVPLGIALRDPLTSKQYSSGASTIFASFPKLSGDTIVEAIFQRLASDGVADQAPTPVGTVLELVTPQRGLAKKAIVQSVISLTVPSLTAFKFGGKSYRTLAAATLNEVGTTSVAFEAIEAGAASDLAIGTVVTLDAPPAGVSASGTVMTRGLAQLFPLAYAPRTVGSALALETLVAREQDGRYSARLGTSPHGT